MSQLSKQVEIGRIRTTQSDCSHFNNDVKIEDTAEGDDQFVTVRLRASDVASACGVKSEAVKNLSVHTQYYDGAVRVALRVTPAVP